jgi:ubiquinone/menaquinone biosynthesis C-methylase UbiE
VDSNQAAYERGAEVYSDLSLLRPEQKLLSLFGDRWPEIEMLDVGIGSGRTTYTFGAVAGRYVGIDYSARMIDLAKRLVGAEKEGMELLEADARDLSALQGPFDFILFSFNGLDSVGHEDRLKILAELRKAIKPDGHFLFSAHSMNALPLAAQRPRGGHPSGLHTAYAWAKYLRGVRRARKVNKGLDLEAGRKRGWMVIQDGAHNFQSRFYYVDPEHQLQQLGEAGFDVIAIYDLAGREVEADDTGQDPWLHYHCRPVE